MKFSVPSDTAFNPLKNDIHFITSYLTQNKFQFILKTSWVSAV